ncbi:MFS transporter [Candidatus Micrarchaeota archaeon]|nr:MFS transporter [Candidatus Micrarchaeota archaeon]
MKKQVKNPLSFNTIIFGIVSFLTDLSTEMLIPILPSFIIGLGGSPALVGLMEGIGKSSASLFKGVSGYLTDHMKRKKPLIIFGYGLSMFVKPFFALINNPWLVIGLHGLERTGKGIRVIPRDAVMGLEEKEVGKAFGFRKMMDSSGAILGPFILLLLLFFFGESMQTYRDIFLLSVIPAALGVLLLFFMKERESTVEKRPFSIPKEMMPFFLSSFVFYAGFMGISLFILKGTELFDMIYIPLLYLAYNMFLTTASLPVGIFADKFGSKITLGIGFALFLFVSILTGFATSLPMLFVVFSILGIVMAIVETVPRVYITKKAKNKNYGSMLGTYSATTGMLLLLSNGLGGLLWGLTIFGMQATFLFAAATSFIALGTLIVYVKD